MKILSYLLTTCVILSLLCTFVSADQGQDVMTEIPLTVENLAPGCGLNADTLTEDQVTWLDGNGFTANGITQISFVLPEEVPMGESIVIRVIGHCDSNFRMWLMEEGAATSSNQINMEQWTFYGGEYGDFDDYFMFTAEDFDKKEVPAGTEFNFKAPTYDTTLVDLTVTYCGIYYGDILEYEAAAGLSEPETEAPETEAPKTEAPETEAPATEAPAETEAPATEAPAEEKGGCGSALTGMAFLPLLALAFVSKRRK